MAEKKKRDANWDSVEKDLLRELVAENNAIEAKDGTFASAAAKKVAWAEAARRFNMEASKRRDIHQLKAQWKAMKVKAKKNISNYKAACRQTGGGERPASPSPEDLKIQEIIPGEFHVDRNVFDSDGKVDDHGYSMAIKCDSILLEDVPIDMEIERDIEIEVLEDVIIEPEVCLETPRPKKKIKKKNRYAEKGEVLEVIRNRQLEKKKLHFEQKQEEIVAAKLKAQHATRMQDLEVKEKELQLERLQQIVEKGKLEMKEQMLKIALLEKQIQNLENN